ncbi:uncharacterized protein LOC127129275 isoform X2 [Lathyrus oleraceus]|uniref:uncharacterized protein LOC127129275 isoform X2 n=1 Tax=Pisum sativum TaxID=3888 RepID=UPI0021D07231|nr:uncharacterized protein LOC127129275 isoform X2 [Pisum sativum]
MDYKDCSLEESKSITSTNRYEEQGLMVAPLNYYKTLSDQIGDYIMEQINSYVQELKALEVGEDPNHRLAMVVFKEGVASYEEKKTGRVTKSVVVGSISVSFELPHFCFDSKIDIEGKNEKEENDVDVIPLEDRRFSIIERANNWTIELRKRNDNRTYDIFSTHLPSNKQFRSKPEVINFVLYEARRKRQSNKRKLTEFASEFNVTGSTSKEINLRRKTSSDIYEKDLGMNMIEWFPNEIRENNTQGGSMGEGKCEEPNEEQIEDDFFEGVERFCLDDMMICSKSNVTDDKIVEVFYLENYFDGSL